MMFNKRPRMRFNPPPNWPPTPHGWTPPLDWSPDPEWGPLPGGWQLWVEEADGQGQNWFVRHKVLTGIGAGVTALMLLCCGIGALAPNSNDKDTVRTAAATSAAATSAAAEKAAAEKAAAEKVAAEKAAAEKAAAEKAAADKAAAEKAAREKAAREKAAREKAAREKAAKEKAARRKVAMPDLVGLKLNIAMDVVHNVGLTNVSVCRTPGGSIPLWYSHWRVIGQEVSAGKRIRVGTEVCLDAMKDSDM